MEGDADKLMSRWLVVKRQQHLPEDTTPPPRDILEKGFSAILTWVKQQNQSQPRNLLEDGLRDSIVAPQKLNKVTEHLFISDRVAAADRDTLLRYGITHILSVLSIVPPFPQDFIYKVVEVEDTEHDDIISQFPDCCSFIDNALTSSPSAKILVHCSAGRSRSCSIIMSYLLYSKRVGNVLDAYLMVKKARSIVMPNPGFREQLQMWYHMGCSLEGDTNYHDLYKFKRMAWQRLWKGSTELHFSPFKEEGERETGYACLQCGRVLFYQRHIIEHRNSDDIEEHRKGKLARLFGSNGDMVGVVGDYEDDTEKEILLNEGSCEKEEEDNDCELEEEPDEGITDWMGGQESPRCDVVFVKLLRWMEKDVTSTQMTGLLHCPDCSTQIGRWAWFELVCRCSQSSLPAFMIFRSFIGQTSS